MKRSIALFEIGLVLLGSIAFVYLIAESHAYPEGPVFEEDSYGDSPDRDGFAHGMQEFIVAWWERSSLQRVSAQESLWTCLKDVNGSSCQEYPVEVCNDQCTVDCFPGRRQDYGECRLGTCFDPTEGTCSAQTPHATCEESGGEWSEESPGQCNPGCCLLGGGAQYITERACSILSERTGIDGEWRTVENEFACLILADQQEEGACVLGLVEGEEKHDCTFTTKASCASLGGEFHADMLCSAEELNTVCLRQDTTSCIDGHDEVYWIDSCGNRENIYDSNKARSWNGGEVLAKEASCSLSSGNNPLGNQRRCGNCEYLTGSICGAPRQNDKAPVDGEFVCRDLSCVDEWGNQRKNGESWCGFDGRIGVDNEDQPNNERAVDVPGSRHYRRVCFDGEVRTDACADFRNEVCVEQHDDVADFSSAACRINQWQLCLEANTDADKLSECETHTDCSLHQTRIDDFAFDVCTPRYPPGFDTRTAGSGEVAQDICSLASQTCTIVEQKSITGKWRCKANCNCEDPAFTQAMNNLCISLGDCGAHTTLTGKIAEDGYSVNHRGSPLSSAYFDGLKKYAEPKKNQFVEPLTREELEVLFKVRQGSFRDDQNVAEFFGKLGLGATGALVVAGAWHLVSSGVPITLAGLEGILTSTGFSFSGGLGATGPTLAGFANVAGAAAVGAAVGFLFAEALGLEGDAYTLMVIGVAVATALDVVIAQALSYSATGGFAGVSIIAVLGTAIIAALVIWAIIEIIGIGKTRERYVEFTCSAWQAPTGGSDCDACDEDGFGCSAYKCQSLGQRCELINEGTADAVCIDVNPNDVLAPVISPNNAALGETFEYSQENNRGVRIESAQSDDGCISAFSPVAFGISLNEPGQCRIDGAGGKQYGQMERFFGGNNLYREDHRTIEVMPALPGIDPQRREEHSLAVRCQDASGNANEVDYVVSFCVAPANDITPPIITEFIPESPGFAGLGVEHKEIFFYTNEPADCRWDNVDGAYEDLTQTAVCQKDLEAVTERGWLCNANLSVTAEDEQNYFFRCLDQPWLAEDDDESNDVDRNANGESFMYQIVKTTEPLIIDFVSPQNETIVAASEPVGVDLEVHTSGGIDGNALCSYNFHPEREEGFIHFFESGGMVHRQTFTALFEGEYDIALQCVDAADNIAESIAEFTVEVDNTGPVITRVYDSSGTLTVVTDEASQCAFDFNSCSFAFEEAELMSGTGLVHTTGFDEGINYHVKCEDTFGNIGGCLVVREGV